jgi:hypothetical protein
MDNRFNTDHPGRSRGHIQDFEPGIHCRKVKAKAGRTDFNFTEP